MKDDWVETSLANACEILDNLRKPINSKERARRIQGKDENELYPYYGATGQVGLIDDYLTDGEFVLIGEDGAPFLDYSKNVAYKINGKTWVNNHAHILKSYFNNDFLLHFLNQIQYKDFVTGTTRLKLTQGALKRIPTKIAPLPIQRAIVSKIENLFASLDKGIADLKKAQQQLKIYRQAVLKKAFEGELTKEWREQQTNLHTADELLEQIKEEQNKWLESEILNGNNEAKRIKSKIKKSTFKSSTKRLPEKWGWTTFIHACLFVIDCHNKTAPYEEEGIYLVRTTNIRDGNLDLVNKIKYVSEDTYRFWSRRAFPKSGDIIFTREAPMGEAAIIPKDTKICLGQRTMLLRTIPFLLENKYLLYNILSEIFQQRMRDGAIGTGVKHLRVGDVENLSFPLCSVQEQHQIVREIESRLSVCDKIEQSIKESLEKSEALRQSILKKAFEGKLLSEDEIEGCKKEGDYEPAGILLERIKKEKPAKS